MVDLINLISTDTNPNDNWAQENLRIVSSITGSPFHPVTYRYNLTNPYDRAALFYFRARGAPKGWKVELTPRKIRLRPGERMVGEAVITPPEKAEVCTSEWVQITSWTPRGDTLINVGGGVVQVDLRRAVAINLNADAGRCYDNDWERLLEEATEAGQGARPEAYGQALRTDGRAGLPGAAFARPRGHPQVCGPAGECHLPHGADRPERLL